MLSLVVATDGFDSGFAACPASCTTTCTHDVANDASGCVASGSVSGPCAGLADGRTINVNYNYLSDGTGVFTLADSEGPCRFTGQGTRR